jgi:hypothetical protein
METWGSLLKKEGQEKEEEEEEVEEEEEGSMCAAVWCPAMLYSGAPYVTL